MLEEIVKSVIFIVLLALGGYFFIFFQKKGWFLSSKGERSNYGSDTLRITERLSVGGRCCIAVVHCKRQKFLIGVSPTSITALGELRPGHSPQNNHQKSENQGFEYKDRQISPTSKDHLFEHESHGESGDF